MKKPAIRLVIFLGVVAIIGIISIQVYFFQVSFNNEERIFNQKIQVALWDVVEQIYEVNEIKYVGKNPVYQYSSDYFVVNVNDFIDPDVLEHYLVKTFEKQGIKLDFEFAVYDCQNDEMMYGKYVNLSKKEDKPSKIALPKHDDFVYYFGIYFPWRKQYLLGNMHSIYFLSGILFFVVLFLGYALVVILQQRRFSELQKDLVNNLTHEFKTPLSSIILSSEVLDDPDIIKEPERINKYSKIIKSQASVLLDHIEKILGMSQVENIDQINLVKVDLHHFLENLSENILQMVNEKNGQLSLCLKAIEPNICEDTFHLNNLIINLIDNSLKYCDKNPDIHISTESNKNHLFLRIADNGIGIEKKYQRKIFKKFYRIPTGNVHNVKGFGLGLSYIYDIIKKHHWRYQIVSETGKGTEFTLFIPIKQKACE